MFTKTCRFPLLAMTPLNEKNIMNTHCVSKKIVGHVPLNWSKVASKFLQFTNNLIHIEVTGKGVNRGVGLGLEIHENYSFSEM